MPEAVAMLEHTVTDLSDAGSARGWHRAAHALVALAFSSPDRATAMLAQFTGSKIWQLRMYAARAAAQLGKRETLDALATHDEDDNVREAAVEGLRKLAGHEADGVYIAELSRPGNQIVRAAALALEGTPHADEAIPALKTAWNRRRDAQSASARPCSDPGRRWMESPTATASSRRWHRAAAGRPCS